MSEKGTEVAEKTEVETKVETTEPEAAQYSQEDMDDVVAEKAKTIVDLESQLKGIKKLQSESALEVNRLKTQPQSSGNIEAMEAMLKAFPQQSDEFGKPVINPEIKKVQARLSYLKQQEGQKQRVAYLEGEKTKMRQEITNAGRDPDSAEFDTVEDAFDLQNIPAARRRLDRVLKKAGKELKVDGKKKPETEEEMEERIRANLVKEYTKQDNEAPSGANLTGGLKEVLAGKDPKEAKQALDKFTRGV